MPERDPVKIETFLLRTVANWATQARIAAIELEEAEQFAKKGRIHRSEQSHEPHPYSGGPCVRVYHCWTVKGGKENPKPKIFQDQKRVIVKDFDPASPMPNGSSTTQDKMFFVSIGTPLRQLAWAHKKRFELASKGKDGGLQVFVSGFLVPLATYEEIIAKAVLSTAGTGDYQNVDPASPDQYGIRKVRELVGDIVPGTLITYVEDERSPFVEGQGTALGEVRHMSVLQDLVGAPTGIGFTTSSKQVDILVDHTDGKFPGHVVLRNHTGAGKTTQGYGSFADECSHAIGLWLGFERGKGLLRDRFDKFTLSDFEARREDGLHRFLARFGFELPPKWRVYADRPREGVEPDDPEQMAFAELSLDPVMKTLDDGAKNRFFEAAIAFERSLGIYLSTNADANQAASEMCSRLFARFEPKHLRALGNMGRPPESSGSVGTDPFQLELVVRQGNMREKLTWVLCAIRSKDRLAARVLKEDLKNLAMRLNTVPTMVDGKIAIPKMRDESGERTGTQRIERTGNDRYTTQRELDVQYPPLSTAERRHALDDNGRLLWEPGSRIFGFEETSSYRTESEEKLRPIAAGASGTAYAMLYVAHLLDVNLLHARLALLSWMLTGEDHSFHEIMEGCARWGRDNRVEALAYHGGDTPRRYRSLAPLSQYDLRRFVCPNGQFPDELI